MVENAGVPSFLQQQSVTSQIQDAAQKAREKEKRKKKKKQSEKSIQVDKVGGDVKLTPIDRSSVPTGEPSRPPSKQTSAKVSSTTIAEQKKKADVEREAKRLNINNPTARQREILRTAQFARKAREGGFTPRERKALNFRQQAIRKAEQVTQAQKQEKQLKSRFQGIREQVQSAPSNAVFRDTKTGERLSKKEALQDLEQRFSQRKQELSQFRQKQKEDISIFRRLSDVNTQQDPLKGRTSKNVLQSLDNKQALGVGALTAFQPEGIKFAAAGLLGDKKTQREAVTDIITKTRTGQLTPGKAAVRSLSSAPGTAALSGAMGEGTIAGTSSLVSRGVISANRAQQALKLGGAAIVGAQSLNIGSKLAAGKTQEATKEALRFGTGIVGFGLGAKAAGGAAAITESQLSKSPQKTLGDLIPRSQRNVVENEVPPLEKLSTSFAPKRFASERATPARRPFTESEFQRVKPSRLKQEEFDVLQQKAAKRGEELIPRFSRKTGELTGYEVISGKSVSGQKQEFGLTTNKILANVKQSGKVIEFGPRGETLIRSPSGRGIFDTGPQRSTGLQSRKGSARLTRPTRTDQPLSKPSTIADPKLPSSNLGKISESTRLNIVNSRTTGTPKAVENVAPEINRLLPVGTSVGGKAAPSTAPKITNLPDTGTGKDFDLSISPPKQMQKSQQRVTPSQGTRTRTQLSIDSSTRQRQRPQQKQQPRQKQRQQPKLSFSLTPPTAPSNPGKDFRIFREKQPSRSTRDTPTTGGGIVGLDLPDFKPKKSLDSGEDTRRKRKKKNDVLGLDVLEAIKTEARFEGEAVTPTGKGTIETFKKQIAGAGPLASLPSKQSLSGGEKKKNVTFF